MHSDVASVTGTSHRICEDYGRANDDNGSFVVIADGCSGSEDSDFGARLLVKQVENRITVDENCFASAMEHAYVCAKDLQLKTECLDATLMTIEVDKDTGNVSFNVFGDGVIAFREGQNIEVFVFNFPSGYPHYLSYSLSVNKDRLAKLEEISKIEGNAPIITSFTILPDGSINDTGCMPLISCFYEFAGSKNGVKRTVFAAMTDGVLSFMRKNEHGVLENVHVAQVIRKLMEFKSLKGEFVQRSLNSLMKDAAKQGWYNVDDVTIGAICLE